MVDGCSVSGHVRRREPEAARGILDDRAQLPEDDPPPDFESWDEAIKAWSLPEDWDEVNAIIDPEGVGPRLWFQRVPEGKVAKNRVHLDVSPGRGITDGEERWSTVLTHVERLVGAGGAVVEERKGDMGERWMVMTDPEGNEFCVQ